MKTVERHKKTDFGDVWYVNAADGTYRFAVYKYDDDNDTIYLSNVFVKEDSRRQGYGNEILASAEEYADRLGASVICLKVLSGSDVHRWYKRHGYEDLEKDEEERGYMWMKKELKRVNESIWTNINKRSEGNLNRKEDDVNLLDIDGLYDYIKSRYENRVFYLDKDWYYDICVDILSNVSLIAKPISNNSKSKLRHILLSWSRVRIRMSLFDKLSEFFNVENINPNRRIITEKDGTCTNKTFIKLIDFFLENIDNILIKESIWSNINKRSEGNLERKEDDVNNLDYIGFYDYLLDKYKDKVDYIDYIDSLKGSASHVRVNVVDGLELSINYSNNKIYNILINCSNGVSFNPDTISEYLKAGELHSNVYEVVEKNGEIFNSTFLKLIDFFIHNIDVLEISESIWSNINKRSEGNLNRKEDDIDHLDFEQFYEYLNSRYHSCYVNQDIKLTTGSLDFIDVPLFCGRTISHLAIYKNQQIKPYIFIRSVDLYPEFIITLKLNYDITIDDVEKGWKSIYIYQKGKRDQDEQNTNSFYVQLIDYILDMDKPEQLKNMLERNVNESIWSNINKRSEGNLERKEDDINLLDGEGFEKYLKKLYKNVDTPFKIIFDVENVITVPIIKYKGQTICVHYDCANNIVYGRFDFLYYHDPDLFEKLRKEYKTFMLKKSFSSYVRFEPRVGELSNEFFIEIIDFYLENCNTDFNIKRILVKNVNESIWSNINKRSEGNQERKEESLHEFAKKSLVNYRAESFAYDFVYEEKYENTLEGYKSYIDNFYKNSKLFEETPKEIVDLFIENHWDKISKNINDYIKVEEDFMESMGFKRGELKSVKGTLDYWWEKLDDEQKEDVLYFHNKDAQENEDKEYETYKDIDEFWRWSNYHEKIEAYMRTMTKTNESIWSNINKRSEGNLERKEDNVDFLDINDFYEYIKVHYKGKIKWVDKDHYAGTGGDNIAVDVTDTILLFTRYDVKGVLGSILFVYTGTKSIPQSILDELNNAYKLQPVDYNRYVITEKDDTCSNSTYIELIKLFLKYKMNESIWSNINKRSEGNQERVEDQDPEMKEKIMTYCRWFAYKIVYEDAYKNDLDDFKKFIYDRNKSYTNYIKRLSQMNNYVEARWMTFKDVIDENIEKLEKKVESQGFKKVPGESISDTLEKWWDAYEYKDDELDAVNNDLDYNERFRTEDEMWSQWDYDEKIECYMNAISQTNECDGVPGGLTPADVGGMGPAYFPGPNGEPGSGDLPMPTGHVYQQVAPFSGFIKMKKSKKKKKKFRKEDEPCSHSPNAKVYDYVDDYREYVDRTYNNVDKRK